MPFVEYLKCPKCNKKYSFSNWKEDNCGFRLRIHYDIDKRNEKVNFEDLSNKPLSHWKYFEFFPLEKKENIISIGEGATPLIKSKRLGKEFGINNLYFKLEMLNPSGSFKDRPISVGVSVAKENNEKALSAASSGNAAASLSSLGASANIPVFVFVPERASLSKVAQLVTLGATVFRVKGGEDTEGDPSVKLFLKSTKEFGWTPCPSFGPFNPFQFEGTKSLSFEIIEQLNEVPDYILANTGSGGLLSGIGAGFNDWKELNWIDSLPKLITVQPEACPPVVSSFNKKLKPMDFEEWSGFPDTVAGGLADPHPWDGDSALKYLYQTNGGAVTVNDKEILEGQKLLASKEGIFAEPSGVAAIYGLKKMIDEGNILQTEKVVIPVTGHGLKDPNSVSYLTSQSHIVNDSLAEIKSILKM